MLYDCISPQISCICIRLEWVIVAKFIGYHYHGPISSLFLPDKSFVAGDLSAETLRLECTNFQIQEIGSNFTILKQ